MDIMNNKNMSTFVIKTLAGVEEKHDIDSIQFNILLPAVT